MVPRQSSKMAASFQSDIESISNSIPELGLAEVRSPISELALRLRQRVLMEQDGRRQTTHRPSVEELLFEEPEFTSGSCANTVQIEGMDLLRQALQASMDLDRQEDDDSISTSSYDDDSCDTDTTTSHEPDDTQLRTRGSGPRRRRCQFLNRQSIGAHLNLLPNELSVDSLRLARTCMDKKHDKNEEWDKITFDSVEIEDDVEPQMETIMVKDCSRTSLLSQKSLSSSNTLLTHPSHRSFGNAAA
ncbi:MAG: hypothetical protein SGILL_003280 [Bacillariaceae sp.]